MRKTLLLIILLPFLALSQKKVSLEINKHKELNSKFEKIAVLNLIEKEIDFETKKIVKEASYADLKLEEIEKLMVNKYQTIEIQIPFKNEIFSILLYKVNPFSEDFKINTDKQKNVPFTKGIYYRGIIKGNESSIASFNFFENEMNGVFSTTELGNINIGKLSNSSQYIVYSDADLVEKIEFKCNTLDEVAAKNQDLQYTRDSQSEKCVTTFLEIGYQAYLANGSDLATSTNWVTSLFNNSQTLFYNDGISIVLKNIFIWTQDEYYSYSSNYILPAYTNLRPEFDGDLGFIIDIDPDQMASQAFGIATLCTDRKFAYGDLTFNINNVPIYSYSVYVMTHELGHSMGSHHTHACVWNGNNTAIDGCSTSYGGCPTPTYQPFGEGTIMSYCGANFAAGFGEQPANAIIQHINSSTCLGTDCINSCINTIGFIDISNVTQNSAIVNWSDSNTNSNQWEISVVPSGNPSIWNTTLTNSYSLENLTPNTYYEVTIRGINCPDIYTYPKHSLIFATQGDNCGGTVIYDTGGLNSGYQSREHIIRTIAPTVPNKKIKLVFNNLNLVPWTGNLFIYDGTSNVGPLVNYLSFGPPFLAGGFGSAFYPNGNTFISQDPSGALTLEFFSSTLFNMPGVDIIPSNSGWRATVSCLNTLGLAEYGDGFIDYSFWPNPFKNELNIRSRDIVENAMVFDATGKQVANVDPKSNDFKVDLSQLSSGEYNVKLTISTKTATFKIIKE